MQVIGQHSIDVEGPHLSDLPNRLPHYLNRACQAVIWVTLEPVNGKEITAAWNTVTTIVRHFRFWS
jgi:hypothetical protein